MNLLPPNIRETLPNKAVNADALFVRGAHYKCAGYGRHYTSEYSQWPLLAERRNLVYSDVELSTTDDPKRLSGPMLHAR